MIPGWMSAAVRRAGANAMKRSNGSAPTNTNPRVLFERIEAGKGTVYRSVVAGDVRYSPIEGRSGFRKQRVLQSTIGDR